MKKSLKLCCGNKGFIFTLDATVAFILLLILILGMGIYLREGDNKLLYMQRTGYDAMLMLDYNNSLKTLNENTILNDMKLFLPKNYDMRILVDGMTIGNIAKGDVVSGNRFFYINKTDFGYLKYYIWQK